MTTRSRRSPRTRASAVTTLLLLAGVAACDSPFGTDDERERLLVPGEPVTGRVSGGDAVVYVVRDTVARPWRLQLQAGSGHAADTLMASLIDEIPDRVVVEALSAGSDTSPAYSAWVEPTPGGRYRVRVQGTGSRSGGTFRLMLQALGSEPESLPRTVGLGDTIAGESLDYRGDVDEFSLVGTPGQEVIIFLQSLGPQLIWLSVVDSASDEAIRQVTSPGNADFLERTSTGVFRLPGAGPYLLRVMHSYFDRPPAEGAPYRLQVLAVNRGPEATAPRLEVGDTTGTEHVDHVGDVDEYGFAGTAGREVVVFAQLVDGDMPGGLRVELLRGDAVLADLVAARAFRDLDSLATARVALPADGDYTLRVAAPAAGPPAEILRRYRLEVYGVDPLPEHVTAAVNWDAPVAGESIDRIGDVDEFTFTAAGGEEVNLLLSSVGSVELLLHGPDGGAIGRAVSGESSDYQFGLPPAGPGTTERVILAAGEHRVRIAGRIWEPPGAWPYEWRIHRIDRAPESVGDHVVPGDTVRGEAIEPVGDVDTFVIDGTAGQELIGFVRRLPGATEQIELFIRVAGSDEPPLAFAWAGETLEEFSTGRFTLPATGSYLATVAGGLGMFSPVGRGPYELLLFPIDRAPERVAAAIAIGDTVRGEAIQPLGDIDELTFTATAGDTLEILLAAPIGPIYATRLEVVDAVTDALVRAVIDHREVETEAGTADTFIVPATGTYRVRVFATANGTNERGEYWFAVTRRSAGG